MQGPDSFTYRATTTKYFHTIRIIRAKLWAYTHTKRNENNSFDFATTRIGNQQKGNKGTAITDIVSSQMAKIRSFVPF